MARARLTLYWRDEEGRSYNSSMYVDDTLFGTSDADLIAALQDLQDMSAADLEKVEVAREIPGSSFTGSQPAAPGSTSSPEGVGHKLIIQGRKVGAPGVAQISVPNPLYSVLMESGAYQGIDLDTNDALVTAMEGTLFDTELLITAESSPLALQKGWIEGSKHS